MPAPAAVPMLSMTSVFLNLLVLIRTRSSLNLRRIIPMLLAGAAGIPIGVWLLKEADPGLIKVVIGSLVAASALIYLRGYRVEVRRERHAMVPVGLLSGILNGATTFSGPPVILFLANQNVDKHQFRASLAAYFLFLNLFAVPAFLAGGLLTGEVVSATARLFPAVVAGSVAGILLADRTKESLFRKLALAALAILGLLSIVSGLG